MLDSFRADILTNFGASTSETEELLAYNQNIFERNTLTDSLEFPLASELHILVWKQYADAVQELGTFEALKFRLVQFQFPIQEGISQSSAYRAATRKGDAVADMAEATGLILKEPSKLQLIIHQSLAGAIPVLLAPNREDFVSLVQALTMRNEPLTVPHSMGACIVGGFNNWDRIRSLRQQWEANNSDDWTIQFQQIIPQKELYQDRFIILSNGFYSGVSASYMELEESEWLRLSLTGASSFGRSTFLGLPYSRVSGAKYLCFFQKWMLPSLTIRLEHECTHYFTRRLFNSMRNNLLDELIADYQGIVAANGYYRADWFLRFVGLESYPDYREGARLQNYRKAPSEHLLSDGAFKILQALVKAAAENLERFDIDYWGQGKVRDKSIQPLMLMSLSHLTLEELACKQANIRIQEILTKL